MTAQMSEKIDNQCDKVNFDGLLLYSIATGEWALRDEKFNFPLVDFNNHSLDEWKTQKGPRGEYKFNISPTPSDDLMRTNLWRGYISQYKLSPEGELYLEKYVYPLERSNLLFEFYDKCLKVEEKLWEEKREQWQEEYEYLLTKGGRPPDIVNEKLTGNFWLVFRKYYEGGNIYVPFIDGKIVLDRNEWKYTPSFDELIRWKIQKEQQGDTLPPNQ